MLIGLVAAGCHATKTSDRSLTMVSPDEAVKAVEGGSGFFGGGRSGLWVDARSKQEFDESRIPGAVHLPIEAAREEHRALREYAPIVVYGRDRAAVRANALSKILMELGHKDVRTLLGGFEAWKDAGFPVE